MTYYNNSEALPSSENLPTITEALGGKKTNGRYTVGFLDMVDSLGRMVEHPAATWMGETEFVYRTIEDVLDQFSLRPHTVLKVEGDGAIMVVPSSRAADLINVMVMIMEVLYQSAQTRMGHFTGDIVVKMRGGIATGELLRFIPPANGVEHPGGIDHIGPPMAIASRLCSAASPNAILADVTTIETADLGAVRSQLRTLRHRTPAEYRGDSQVVRVKGLKNPLPYHEIHWHDNLFGLASTAVTETTKPPTPSGPPAVTAAPPERSTGRRHPEKAVGKIKTWREDLGWGFVSGPGGEDFYLNRRGLVYADEDGKALRPGVEVAFTIAPPVAEGKARRALAALVVGAEADGKLVYRHATGAYGYIDVADERGTTLSLYVRIPSDSAWPVGTELAFIVGSDPRGPVALNPEILVDDTSDGNGGTLTIVGGAA